MEALISTTMTNSESPPTLQHLMSWINAKFHCVMGPPRAYLEVPLDNYSSVKERWTYVTYKVQARGHRSDVERELLRHFKGVLANSLEGLELRGFDLPLLLWRRIPTIEEARDAEGPVTSLYARLFIPGCHPRG